MQDTASIYQVITWYREPSPSGLVSYGPWEDADAARARYGDESLLMASRGVRGVYLTRHGIIVAQAVCCAHMTPAPTIEE